MKDTEQNGVEEAVEETITIEEAATDYEARRFLSALKAIKKGYIWALIITACITAGSIVCAVHYRASVGILLLAFAVAVYLAIIINLLYSKLGIAYQAFHGGMTVTALYGKGREIIYIPDRVMLLTVTEIGTRAFSHESSKSIREIHLPKTLLRIGTSAFADLPALTDVYYEGSEEEWAEISRLAPLENVTLHFGEPIPRLEKRKRKKQNAKNIESEKHEESNDNE